MAGKKKKGKKSGRLAKLSDEDRIIHEENRRIAEEEMRKKKEDMLTQFLKVKYIVSLYLIIYNFRDCLHRTICLSLKAVSTILWMSVSYMNRFSLIRQQHGTYLIIYSHFTISFKKIFSNSS